VIARDVIARDVIERARRAMRDAPHDGCRFTASRY
jgi:hypothetical protein